MACRLFPFLGRHLGLFQYLEELPRLKSEVILLPMAFLEPTERIPRLIMTTGVKAGNGASASSGAFVDKIARVHFTSKGQGDPCMRRAQARRRMFVHIFFDPQSSKGVAPLVFWADF
jgi:hypothetical protein